MAAFFAVLLFLLPIALYTLWRRLRPAPGGLRTGTVFALLLGVGLMLGSATWFGFSRSLGPEQGYAPARLGPDGRVLQGGAVR